MPIDPNLVYLILIIGLWLSVTAAHLPGTGVIEALAVLGVIGALVTLASMPTNWWAVILIVAGLLSFLIIPLLNRRLAPLAVGGLALQTVGSLTLFNGASVSLPLIVLTIAVSLIYYRFALLRILAYHQNGPVRLEDEPLIGLQGYVQRALDPVGTVFVRGESWTARSDDKLEPGTPIVVVDHNGLTLYVEAIKQKRQPQEVESNGL